MTYMVINICKMYVQVVIRWLVVEIGADLRRRDGIFLWKIRNDFITQQFGYLEFISPCIAAVPCCHKFLNKGKCSAFKSLMDLIFLL